MQVTCGSCGATMEVDDATAPLSGILPSCPQCDPSGTGKGSVEDPFGFGNFDIGAPGTELSEADGADRDKTTTYQLAGLTKDVMSMLETSGEKASTADELFGTMGDDDADMALEQQDEPAEKPVQAEDLFALFADPVGGPGAEPPPAVAVGGAASEPPSARGATDKGAWPVPVVQPAPSPVGAAGLPAIFGNADGGGTVAFGATPPEIPTIPPPGASETYATVKPGSLTEDIFKTAGGGMFGDAPGEQGGPGGGKGEFDGSGDLLAALGLTAAANAIPDSSQEGAASPDSDSPPASIDPFAAFAPPEAGGVGASLGQGAGTPAAPTAPEIDFGASRLDGSSAEEGEQAGVATVSAPAASEPLTGADAVPPSSSTPMFDMGGDAGHADSTPLALDLSGTGISNASRGGGAGPASSPSTSSPSPSPFVQGVTGTDGVRGIGGSGFGGLADSPPSAPLRSQSMSSRIAASIAPSRISRTGTDKVKVIAFAGLAALVLGGVVWLWNFSGASFSGHSEEKAPAPVAAIIEDTLRHNPEILEHAKRSTRDELVQQGLSLLRDDTAIGYREARNSFIEALSLSPNRPDAMALYVESTLHVRPQGVYMPACREIMDLALKGAPESSLVHRVNAFLLMREERELDAEAEAEKAVSLALPEEKADALLMQGQAFLRKSAPVALEKIAQAVQLDPKLKRAIYFQGVAAENSGDLLKAAKAFDARLAIDAKERDSMQGLVRVYLKLGHLEDARRALASYLKSYPNDTSPKLWEAALSLRLEKDAGKAASQLKKIEATLAQMSASEKGQFHRLNAERLIASRDYAAAKNSVAAAIDLDPRDAAAHFLGLKVAIARKDAAEAKSHLKACRRHLANGLYHEFMGRVAVMEGNLDEALEAFQKSNEENGQRLASLMMEGVLHLKKGNERGAWSLHSRIMGLDPYSRSKEAPSFDDFAEPETPLMELCRANLSRVPAGAKDNSVWLHALYAALVAYHLGETGAPSRIFDQVLSADPTSMLSLAYRAQIELDRRNYKKARRFIDTAIGIDSRDPMPWYLRGKLFLATKDMRNARDSWVKVLELSPRHTDAEIQLAFLSISQGDRNDALSRLRRVLFSNPHLERVRSALFDLERAE